MPLAAKNPTEHFPVDLHEDAPDLPPRFHVAMQEDASDLPSVQTDLLHSHENEQAAASSNNNDEEEQITETPFTTVSKKKKRCETANSTLPI